MDGRKYAQAQKFTIAVGISTTDTSITLQSFNFPDGTAIAAGDLGSINYGTLEPGTSREESISFTGITSNADGTVTLTGVTRGLGFGAVNTYSEQSNLKSQHGTGAIFILSNTAAFYNDFVNKNNDEEMAGMLSVQTPTSASHAATKQYVDDNVNGGAVSNDRIVQAATAGESVAAGDLVYFDDTDNEWKKTVGTTAATLNNVLLGIAQGSGSNGGAISGGVLTYGLDSTQTGLTVGVKLYAGDTAGDIVDTAGTVERVIGWSKSATEIYFDANVEYTPTAIEKDAMAGGGDFGTPSASNKFLTEGFVGAGDGSDGDVVISVDTTLTEDKFYNNLTINSGIKLYPDGYRIFVKGTLTGPGTISFNGNDGADATDATTSAPGVGGAAGAASGSGPLKTVAGTAGETGANTTTAQSGGGTAADNTTPGVSGSRGGAGGSDGGDATQVSAAQASIAGTSSISENWKMLRTSVINLINLPTSVDLITQAASTSTGGGGGVGNNSGNTLRGRGGGGGGGGASGGFIFVVANSVVGPITFEAIGGDGGNGSNGNSDPDNFYGGGAGGAGGAGGTVILVYGRKTGTNTYTLTGGTGGTGGTGSSPGNGAAGTNGLTGAYYELKYSDLM